MFYHHGNGSLTTPLGSYLKKNKQNVSKKSNSRALTEVQEGGVRSGGCPTQYHFFKILEPGFLCFDAFLSKIL